MKTSLLILLITFTQTVMAKQKQISTQIIINGTPEQVWSVLTDYDSYSEWNPFIDYIVGDVKQGNKIKVKLGGMKFKPTVLNFIPNSDLKWLGHLGFKGIFDGEHRFELIDNGDGTTTFIQSEKFNGLLVSLFSKKLDTETVDSFRLMNEALKKRVEEM